MSQKWGLVTQYQGQNNELEAKAKEEKDQVATYNANILSWMKQMDELQQKIKEVEQKKFEIKTSKLASIEEKMVQEAKFGIQHSKAACALNQEIQNMKIEDSMNDTKVIFSKNHFKKVKVDFPF